MFQEPDCYEQDKKNLKNNDGINYKYIFQVYKFLKGAMHYTIKF